MFTHQPKITVITVVYNDAKNLERTFESIRNQINRDFEYIVIDGCSKDGTLDTIRKNEDLISHWISEPDEGIYDAMNKGIRLANGQYLNFMNAGDSFFEPTTIEDVCNALDQKPNTDILYGKVVKLSSEASQFYYEKGEPLSNQSFFLSTPMCHQTMFIAKHLFNQSAVGQYDLSFKAGVFYEWLAKYYSFRRELSRIYYLNKRLAIYLDGGYSFRVKRQIDIDRMKSVHRHFNVKYTLLNFLRFCVEYIKGWLLPLVEHFELLDTYRKLKYGSKNKELNPIQK